MMEQKDQEKILALLREKFEGWVLHSEMVSGIFTLTLNAGQTDQVIYFLYHHPDLKFQYLTTLCGIHNPEQHQVAVMYQLANLEKNHRLRIKVCLPEVNPVAPTITHVFAGANWMERETYDFYGIVFQGHPNLKRILNVDDMLIFPLRKEYPLEDQVREDKNDTMFGR